MLQVYRFHTALFLFLLGVMTRPAAAQSAGGSATLRGTVTDAATGEVLIGATVVVPATGQGVATGLNGTFQLRSLAPGVVLVQARSLGFEPQTLSVTLLPGAAQTLDFRLAVSGQELKAVTVTGQADRESDASVRRSEQRADNVLNIISAKAIELSPDIQVGNVVQRASGVSIVRNSGGDGQYAIIRGIDPRYNYTLVNGVKIPSPDPKNRYAPLDIFPAELLERLEVVKALTPNMEGDAIGGALNLVMKSAPDHLVVAATAAGGYSDLFAQRPYAGFSSSGLAQQSPGETHPAGYVAQPSDFSNKSLNYSSLKAPVNSLFGLTLGNRTRDGKLGLLVAGSLQNTYRGSDRLYYHPLGGPKPEPLPNTFTFDEIQRIEFSTLQNRLGLHAKLDYAPNARNRIGLYSLWTRLDDAQHRHLVSNDLGTGGDVPTTERSRFQRQQLWAETLQGDHDLGARLHFNWSAVYGRATYATPDLTTIGTVRATAANTQQGTFVQSNGHLWQRSLDQDLAGYANLSYHATETFDLAVGGLLRNKDRSNFYDYYDLTAATTGTGTNNRQPLTTYDQAQFVFASGYDGQPKTTDGNNYTANERIAAGYAQGKLLLVEHLQVLGGVRVENTNQRYDSQAPPTVVGRSGTISYLDVLPSLHFKYLLSEHQNLRLSYFKSISRPALFELVPASSSYNGDVDISQIGNPLLKHTQAHNLDLRFEHYGPANSQLLAGVFYKQIQNAIEFGFLQVSNNTFYYAPINPAGTATNFGAELQFNKYIRNWG
ncbi:TonB-dependent receptor domain-containing protein [Hymenobacter sp. BRD67]|uniref:TonB-dependent receptor n=1 Tax=Hymenobacter sp. BRD67 TaxID=2675877 RepID=UPI0039779B76